MSEFLQVAKEVLKKEGKPLRVSEILKIAQDKKMLSDKLSGNTPGQTMKSKITVHILKFGDRSEFVRTGKGLFYLREMIEDKSSILSSPPKLRKRKKEDVLVFRNAWLDARRKRFLGVLPADRWKTFFGDLKSGGACSYINRIDAELDSNFKQIVTYVLIGKGDKILSFRRGSFNRTEDFLKGSACIGFGGHVSIGDQNLFGQNDFGIKESARRELTEELRLPEKDQSSIENQESLKVIGFINDDSSEVGRRHFAVVFRYEVAREEDWEIPSKGENSITQLRWIDPSLLAKRIREYEYWSQLCIRKFFPDASNLASYRKVRPSAIKSAKVIFIVGPVGSGKSVAAKLIGKHGYHVIKTGSIVAKHIGLPKVPETSREKFQRAANEFITQPSGPKLLAESIVTEIEKFGNMKVIVDGVRQRSTLEELINRVGKKKTALVYVHTPFDVAYKFYKARENKSSSIDDFINLREASVEKDVEKFVEDADAVLYNWEGQTELKRAVQELMESVGGEA